MLNVFISPMLKKNNYKKYEIVNNLELINYFSSLNFFCSSSFSSNTKYINQISKKNDLLVLSGGGDISYINKNSINITRDNFEKKLVKSFIKEKKPIITICRGFQLVAVLMGANIKKIKNHVRVNHKINIIKKNKFINFKSLNTNSYHNFGISNLPKEFEISGTTKDGCIEISINNNKRLLCFMFHPERKNKSRLLIKKTIVNFINEFVRKN